MVLAMIDSNYFEKCFAYGFYRSKCPNCIDGQEFVPSLTIKGQTGDKIWVSISKYEKIQ